ncbi:MAG: epoxyqueuosine reductase [Nitrospiraceae bacterium]|nr:MAG: epoxyqueuosine reductase [Nitrospiraceae bacterium]
MYNELKDIAVSAGLTAFGVGHIEDLRPHFDALPMDQTEKLSCGISIGARVSASVLKSCITGPTRHYLHHYKMLNLLLDQTALKISLALQDKGYNALPVPASQIVDWEKQTAHLSHKMVALRAGIGWIGRNNLLVHPAAGSGIRIATVLTDMPLQTDKPLEKDCGSCRKCMEICPVSAIKESYKEWDKAACLEKLKYFARAHNVGQYICGLCVKACQPL